jgi:hypothetical protein
MKPSVTLTGKLKSLFPSLYSTLSLWEKEALDNSRWIFLSTTIDKGINEGDMDPTDPVLAGSARPTVTESSPAFVSGVLPSILTESPIPSPTEMQQNILPQLFNTWARTPNSSPSSPEMLANNLVEPGFRESEVDDSTLSVVLDSLIPFIQDSNASIKLPTYLGKAILDPTTETGANTSQKHTEGDGKEFSWSKGLGIEHSPVKTRSIQKKLVVLSSQSLDSVPSSTDSGALRAMKAMARAK